jgi:pyridoxal phosphate enzyme (YggS family)
MRIESVAGRIAAVRVRIALACERVGRDPSTVTLIGVSKTWPAEAVIRAYDAGLRDFGENRVQEALPKIATLADRGFEPAWHLVGHLQTNKVRAAVGAFAILQAIDSERLLEAISMASPRPVRIMIEVNVSGEETKFGVAPAGLPGILATAAGLPNIVVEGLMTVPPRSASPGEARPVFGELRRLAETSGLPALSMGMTDDYEIAIEEGATHVRIGRAIFGERA